MGYVTELERKVLLILFVAGLTLIFACAGKSRILGRWSLKDEVSICNLAYPKEIEFFEDGEYVTRGLGVIWNGGKFSIVDKRRIKMETTTGLDIYEFSISGDVLTFVNKQGCSFSYRKTLHD